MRSFSQGQKCENETVTTRSGFALAGAYTPEYRNRRMYGYWVSSAHYPLTVARRHIMYLYGFIESLMIIINFLVTAPLKKLETCHYFSEHNMFTKIINALLLLYFTVKNY